MSQFYAPVTFLHKSYSIEFNCEFFPYFRNLEILNLAYSYDFQYEDKEWIAVRYGAGFSRFYSVRLQEELFDDSHFEEVEGESEIF